MEPEVKHGFFTMDAVTAVCNETDLSAAKQIATACITKQCYATPENIAKAHQMVQRAKTIKNLGLGMTNFLLAHPSENLKIIR